MTWRGRAALALGAIAAYLGFLVASFPAALVVARLLPPHAPVQLQHVQGSVWSGSAATVLFMGTPLGRVHWSLVPWRLLRGEITADVDLSGESRHLSGRLAWSFGGRLSADGVDLELDPELLSRLGVLPLPVRGLVQGRIEHLDWRLDGLPLVAGDVTWKGAGLTLPASVDLGQIHIRSRIDGKKTRIVWDSKPGALGTEGTLSLEPPLDYQLKLSLSPQDSLDSGAKNALRMLGRPGADGSYRLSYSGRLSIPRVMPGLGKK